MWMNEKFSFRLHYLRICTPEKKNSIMLDSKSLNYLREMKIFINNKIKFLCVKKNTVQHV